MSHSTESLAEVRNKYYLSKKLSLITTIIVIFETAMPKYFSLMQSADEMKLLRLGQEYFAYSHFNSNPSPICQPTNLHPFTREIVQQNNDDT